MHTQTLWHMVLLASLVACDSSIDPPDPIDAGSANYSASLGDDPDFSDPHGRVVVRTWFEYEQTSLDGAFYDGPPLRMHTESERIGNCRLMSYTASTCDPGCTDGDVCIDGSCASYPMRQDRGDLTWVWPDGERTISPDDLFGYYATDEAHTTGEVSITVQGSTLVAPTLERPEQDGDWATILDKREAGADATLRWSNPVNKARVRLHMTDCVGSHGGFAPAEIECEGPDTGSIVLPGPFLDKLEAGDWSHGECGSHTFDRLHAASPTDDTTVRLETVSDAGFFYFPGRN